MLSQIPLLFTLYIRMFKKFLKFLLRWLFMVFKKFPVLKLLLEFRDLVKNKVSWKIPENLWKFFILKMSNIGAREEPGGATGWPHPRQARPALGPRLTQVWAHPAPSFSLSPLILLILPKISAHTLLLSCSCSFFTDSSISLLSQYFLLKFSTFALRYVTPPNIQVDFRLVEYFLSN